MSDEQKNKLLAIRLEKLGYMTVDELAALMSDSEPKQKNLSTYAIRQAIKKGMLKSMSPNNGKNRYVLLSEFQIWLDSFNK